MFDLTLTAVSGYIEGRSLYYLLWNFVHESSILQTPPYGLETAVTIKNGYERWPITYPARLLWQLPMSVQACLPLSNLDSEGCPTDILELALVDSESLVKRFKFSSCRQFSITKTAREDLSIVCLRGSMFLEYDRNNYGHWLVHYGCVRSFASRHFQLEGPFSDRTEHNGWTVDEVNTLVAWLFYRKRSFQYSF